jgi:hypothetical protein
MIVLAGINLRVIRNSLRTGLFYQGESVRMAAGNVISTESDPKRWAEFTVVFTTPADEATVRAAHPRGTAANLDWPDGTTSLGIVEFGQEEWMQANTGDTGYVSGFGVSLYKRVGVRIEET